MDKHIAHVFRDDLEKLQNSECAVTVYSVEMRDPDRGETIPLVVADQPPPAPVAEELEVRIQPAAPDVDALAEFIRDMEDGEYIPYHEFAQHICNWIEEQKNDQ